MGTGSRVFLNLNAGNNSRVNNGRLVVCSVFFWCLCSLFSYVSFDLPKASFATFIAAILIMLFDAGFLRIAQDKTGKDLRMVLLLVFALSCFASVFVNVVLGISYLGIPGSAGFVFSTRRCILMTLFMFPALLLAAGCYLKSTSSLFDKIKQSVLIHCGIAVVFSFASYFLCKAIIGNSASSSFRSTYLIAIAIVLLCVLALLRLKAKNELHIIFVYIAVLLGSFLVLALPHVTGISPDDQIHFERALGLSFLGYGYSNDADRFFSVVPWVENNVLDFEHMEDIVVSLNNATYSGVALSASFEKPIDHSPLSFLAMVSYIPSAFGLMIGKSLGLKATYYLLFGKFFNLFFYCVVVATAIRILPTGKMLALIVGILPTNLYLASNYSYDPWVTSLIMLGAALVLREKFSERETVDLFAIILVAVVFLLALSAKAIYFPLIMIMLLIPRGKFQTKSDYRRYVGFVGFIVLLAIMSFVVPMFGTSSGMEGDARGGQDVSASGQIINILAHPLYSAGVIASYVAWYISPIASDGFTLNYAYMGNLRACLPCAAAIPYVLIASFGFSGERKKGIQLSGIERAGILLLSAVSVFLVVVALYVTFTPVGLNWVSGCSPRYLEPLLFPVLLGLFGNRAQANTAEYLLLGAMTLLSFLIDYYCVVNWSLPSFFL